MKNIVKNFDELVELVNNSISICYSDLDLQFDLYEYGMGEYNAENGIQGFPYHLYGYADTEIVLLSADENWSTDSYFTRSEEYAKSIVEEWIQEFEEENRD